MRKRLPSSKQGGYPGIPGCTAFSRRSERPRACGGRVRRVRAACGVRRARAAGACGGCAPSLLDEVRRSIALPRIAPRRCDSVAPGDGLSEMVRRPRARPPGLVVAPARPVAVGTAGDARARSADWVAPPLGGTRVVWVCVRAHAQMREKTGGERERKDGRLLSTVSHARCKFRLPLTGTEEVVVARVQDEPRQGR
jgi:hypothetical protein